MVCARYTTRFFRLLWLDLTPHSVVEILRMCTRLPLPPKTFFWSDVSGDGGHTITSGAAFKALHSWANISPPPSYHTVWRLGYIEVLAHCPIVRILPEPGLYRASETGLVACFDLWMVWMLQHWLKLPLPWTERE